MCSTPFAREALIRRLRADVSACQEHYGDAGTADFLVGLMAQHEKTAWILRAHLTDAHLEETFRRWYPARH